MTDSTTDSPGDGGFDVGSSADELFGEFEETDMGDQDRTESAVEDETDRPETGGIEDRTAAAVFDQLRTEGADEGGADDVLADESPDDIIASADEPESNPATSVDDEFVVDDGELTELLLTDRTKDQEFLWVDADESDDPRDNESTDLTGTDEELERADAETPSVDGDDDSDAPTATAPGTVDESSDGESGVENGSADSESAIGNGSADAIESDVATVTDTDSGSDTATAVDADAAPETPSNPSADTAARSDDAGSSLDPESDAPAVDPGPTDCDGDDAESDTVTEETEAADAETETETESETETAVDETEDATAADDEPSGLLGRLRSLLGGLF
ncbi:MSCRAMM family adhesin SdrC [Natrinema amylolyticum]|uniref:MSCRAMM family adhesin SdrC n=1 Tax=Natrinema amylolyticum TaxID=2878679 RepID=UPI001CFC3270|nr:MSCRAMM family adhesin SdrC [Natrinema amylolyticum]